MSYSSYQDMSSSGFTEVPDSEITLSLSPGTGFSFGKNGGSETLWVSTNARYFKIDQGDIGTNPWAVPFSFEGTGPGGKIHVRCGVNEGGPRAGDWTFQAFNKPSDFNTSRSVKRKIRVTQEACDSSDSGGSYHQEWEFSSSSSGSGESSESSESNSSSCDLSGSLDNSSNPGHNPTSSCARPSSSSYSRDSSSSCSSCSSDSSFSDSSSSGSSSSGESSESSSSGSSLSCGDSGSSESSFSSSGEESFSSDTPPYEEPDCRSDQCRPPCDEECTEGDADIAQSIPLGDPEEEGMCGGSLTIGNPGPGNYAGTRSRAARSGRNSLSVNVFYDSPMEATASFDGKEGKMSMKKPSGNMVKYGSGDGGGTAAPTGTSSTKPSMVRYMGPNGEDSTAADASSASVVMKDGSSLRFSTATGRVSSMKTAGGAVITAEQYNSRNSVTRNASGEPTSIWNDKGGMLVLDRSGDKLTVFKYAADQVSMSAEGIRTAQGTPVREYSYETSMEGNAAVMKIVNKAAGTEVREMERRVEGNRVTVIVGKGNERVVTVYERSYPGGTLWQEVRTVTKGFSTMPYSRICTLKEYTPMGWKTLSRTEGYETALARTTTWEYDERCRVAKEARPDGGWTRYEYDERGRVVKELSPWTDGVCTRIVRTSYADLRFNDHRPSIIRESILDPYYFEHDVRKTVYAYEDSDRFSRVTESVTAAGAEDPRIRVTEHWGEEAPCSYARGRIRMERGIDGVETVYTYEAADRQDADWKVTQESRVEGVPVPGCSVRTVRWLSGALTVSRKEEYALAGSVWSLVSAEDYEYDAEKRLTKTTHGNGRVSTTEWMCCGPRRQVDEDGVATEYEYDSARRLVSFTRSATETTPETITTLMRDGEDRILSTRIDAGAMTTARSHTYDILGRPTSETDELGRVTRYAYGADGLTTTKTLPSGATEVTVRNSDGSLREEGGSARRAVAYSYVPGTGGIRQNISIRSQNGWKDGGRILRDGFGGLTKEEQPTTLGGWLETLYAYNAKGQLVRSRTGTMAPVLYEYDPMGELSKKTLALADTPTVRNSPVTATELQYKLIGGEVYRETKQVTWNEEGTPLTEIRRDLLSQMNSGMESKTVLIDARGNFSETWTEYSSPGKRTHFSRIPAAANRATEVAQDGFTVERTDYAGVTTSRSRIFTASGLKLAETDGRNNATVTETDMAGRTVKVTDASGAVTATEYDSRFDLPYRVTDALGKTTCYAYDNRGRKTAEFGTGIQPACFGYDDAGRLASLTTFRAAGGDIETNPGARSDGDTTAWTYHDATDLPTRKTFADGAHEDFTYDAYNRLSVKTDARGIATAWSYSALTGLPTGMNFSDNTPAQSYVWDHLGRLTRATDASGTRTFGYNACGQLLSDSLRDARNAVHTVTESYDALGRGTGYACTSAAAAILQVACAYGTDARLSRTAFTHNGQEQAFTYGYLPGAHLLGTRAMPNGLIAERTYEPQRDLVSGITVRRSDGTVVTSKSYSCDLLGRPVAGILKRNAATRNDSIAHNKRDEITRVDQGGNLFRYNYDNTGNRKQAQEPSGATAYTANSLNQYTALTAAGTVFAPQHDAAGNQTKIKTATGIWNITCNAENRPVRFTSADKTVTVECAYDCLGRRAWKKVTRSGAVTLHHQYLYRDYLQIAALDLLDNGRTVRTIVWDPLESAATCPLALVQNGRIYSYGSEFPKNISEIFNEEGALAVTYDYTPYGHVTSSGDLSQPIQWSSEMYDDELALVYYNFRYYNPEEGRWTGRDPVEEAGGFNLYSYVRNTRLADILGLTEYRGYLGNGTMLPYSSYPSYGPSPDYGADTTGSINKDAVEKIKDKAQELDYNKPQKSPSLDPEKPSKLDKCIKKVKSSIDDIVKKTEKLIPKEIKKVAKSTKNLAKGAGAAAGVAANIDDGINAGLNATSVVGHIINRNQAYDDIGNYNTNSTGTNRANYERYIKNNKLWDHPRRAAEN